MTRSRNPWVVCLAIGALVLTLVGAPWLAPAGSLAEEYDCSGYTWREDAQNQLQDPDACPDLPSKETASTATAPAETEPTATAPPETAPTQVPADGEGQGSEYPCSAYIYREDAQTGFQDPEACPELPSRDTAPTCGQFATQAEAQAFYDQDPYRYWTLTDYGRGIGPDMATACPELAAAPPVVVSPTPAASVTTPDRGRGPGDTSGISSRTDTGSPVRSSPADRVRVTAANADEPNGSDAIIVAGTCDTETFGDPLAELTDVTSIVGEATGAGAFSTVATSLSSVELTLDELLAGDHVLVVFDEIQTERALSCGPIGGVIAGDGSLSIGLRETPGAGWSGVAYLSPDAGGTSVTIFLAEGLAPTDQPTQED